MAEEQGPADGPAREMERFERSLKAMSEGLEGMMAATIHMQILMLEDARAMMREMEAAAGRPGRADPAPDTRGEPRKAGRAG